MIRSDPLLLIKSSSGVVGIAKGVDGFEHDKNQFVPAEDSEPELMSEVSGSLNVCVGKDVAEEGIHIADVAKSKFISSEKKRISRVFDCIRKAWKISIGKLKSVSNADRRSYLLTYFAYSFHC